MKQVNQLGDPEWLDLKALQRYVCASERTLREWIHRPVDPLPAARVGSKILVRRRSFDAWLEKHRVANNFDVNSVVNTIIAEITN